MNAVKAFLLTQYSFTITAFGKIKIPIQPVKLKIVLNKNASSTSFLNNKIKTPKAQTIYADKGLIFYHRTWTNYYLIPFKCVKDTTLIWFQYRLLHRILGTNTFL